MSTINYAAREITCKLVYCGPGLSGKTTNLRHIYDHTRAQRRGKMVSLETDAERTLFFDFFPLSLGKVGGFEVRMHLYTVPGQVYYYASRKLIIRNADGFVFVADSQVERSEANAESLEDFYQHLRDNDMFEEHMPMVLQCNKQDVLESSAPADIRAQLSLEGVPTYAAVAATGEGVRETFEGLARLVMKRLREGSKR